MTEQIDVLEKIKEGLELFRRRCFVDAVAILRRVIDARPESFYGWFHLGRALYYLGNVEEAKAAFQHALHSNVELANSWMTTGRFCGLSTGYQTDESCLAEYLYEHEQDGEIRKLLAEIFYDNRSIVKKDHCFEEQAISVTGASGEGELRQTILERRNCHITTH